MRYSLIGDATATQYFYVNPTTGQVSIKKPLSSTDVATFTVCQLVQFTPTSTVKIFSYVAAILKITITILLLNGVWCTLQNYFN